MIVRTGDNIISALGFTTDENYRAVKAGGTGLRPYGCRKDLPEPFVAALIDRERLNDCFSSQCSRPGNYTPLEKAAILSAGRAAEAACLDLSGSRVAFFFSSTKGNIHLLDEKETGFSRDHLYLWHTAQTVAGYFRNPNTPVVVSNACISGASAQIAALRELEAGYCDYAVVTGVDFLSRFIIAGFQSLKALSPAVCRPFDAARSGLNLGEAAATLIYKRVSGETSGVALLRGSVRNDANHISGPSRTGEGSFLALQAVMEGLSPEDTAFINAHGTATSYNDRMEAIAITRAGLHSVYVNSLKGSFGHTLGAAGVLESILSIRALQEGIVLPVPGFETGETDFPLKIATAPVRTTKSFFVKMLSGFGGCNAALVFKDLGR
ncbi:MAG: beta-ketoacyl synthase [Dysgonamonadaceae bacterium]|jgi:3-oxoacyl-[acyl-carrier-protein] synthase-1|nr:beta-ketoacyl synthase [Dysgonamonadaceae bacterium]